VYINFTIKSNQETFEKLYEIQEQIENWAGVHQVAYTEKFHKGNYRVAFNDTRDFMVFFLSWTGPEYEIVGQLES
jgi:hypothetical protein